MLDTSAASTAQRVRHPIKARLLQVRRVARLTPLMIRVTFHSPGLSDFVSSSFDDHIKLFFPADGVPVMPEPLPEGLRFPDGAARPPSRDYTPRRHRPGDEELDIDFLLHGDGPASNWAAQARAGDRLVAAGPRGSFVIPDAFDWQLMIGDETALPAIGRRLEELPQGHRVHVIALVRDAAEEQALNAPDGRVTWIHRHALDGRELLAAVQAFTPPPGEGYVWGAGEAAQMRAVHHHLAVERNIDKSRLRISNYWKRDE